MKNLVFTSICFIIKASCFATSFNNSSILNNELIEKIVYEEAAEINKIQGSNVVFHIGKSTITNKDNGVTISTDFLQEISTLSKIDDIRLLVRMVIAHEYFHYFQFVTVGQNNLSRQLNLLLECEADIFAGMYLYRKYIVDNKDKFNNALSAFEQNQINNIAPTKYFEQEQKFFDAVYTVFIDLGNKYENTYHPNGDQRLSAIKIGMRYSLANEIPNLKRFYLDLFGSNLPGKNNDEKIQQLINASYYFADYLPSDTYGSWSVRQAEKILHFNHLLSKYIEIEDYSVDFDEDADNPYVYYSFTINNNAPVSVKAEFSIVCATVKRNDTKNEKLSSISDIANYQYEIAPKRSIKIKDTLKWSADSVFYPRLIGFTAGSSLYSFKFLHRADLEANLERSFVFTAIKLEKMAGHLPILMSKINQSAKANFKQVQSSPTFIKEEGSFFTCFWADSPILAYSYDNKGYNVTITLYEGSDTKKALDIFNEGFTNINQFLEDPNNDIGAYKNKKIKEDDEEKIYYFIPTNLKREQKEHFWAFKLIKKDGIYTVTYSYYYGKSPN